MKAVELLLAYAHGRPRETIHSGGDTPGQAASASVVIHTKQEKASFANDGADITQVRLPANGYEIDPETRQPMFPELAGDPDEGEKLLAYAGMELPTKPVAETAPIAAAETPIKKIGGPIPKQKQAEPQQRVPSDIFDPTTNINPVDSMEAVVEPARASLGGARPPQ